MRIHRVRSVVVSFAAFAAMSVTGSARAQMHDTQPTAGYEKGFFIRSADGRHMLVIGGRHQTRLTHVRPDSGPNETAFSVERGTVSLSGNAFGAENRFKLQLEMSRSFAVLTDAYVERQLHPWFVLRAGQWERPFNRQRINSSSQTELVDRSDVERFFSGSRDIGIAVHDDYESSPEIEYVAGLFNGTGERPWFQGEVTGTTDITTGATEGSVARDARYTNVPARMHPTVIARVGYNYGGIKGYSEGDLEGGPLRFSVGAGTFAELDYDKDGASSIRATGDFSLKVHGFSTTGAFYWMRAEAEAVDPTRTLGALAQASYLVHGLVMPALRWGRIMPEGEDNDRTELTGCVDLFLEGHRIKLQVEGSQLRNESAGGGDSIEYRVRGQFQLLI